MRYAMERRDGPAARGYGVSRERRSRQASGRSAQRKCVSFTKAARTRRSQNSPGKTEYLSGPRRCAHRFSLAGGPRTSEPKRSGAVGAAGARFLHTEEVAGSIPARPTRWLMPPGGPWPSSPLAGEQAQREDMRGGKPLVRGSPSCSGPGARAAGGPGGPVPDEPVDGVAGPALLVDQAAHNVDERGHRPEVPAYPEDGGTNLLAGQGRERDAGNVIVDGVPRAAGEEAERDREDPHEQAGRHDPGGLPRGGQPGPEWLRRQDLQPEQDAGDEEAAAHQPDMHVPAGFGQ